MSGIVVDASVTLSRCFADEQTDSSMGVLDRLQSGEKAIAPALDYATLEQVAGPVQIIWRDHRLTPYDALYVELAQRSGCPLATLDQPQKDAAGALGVHCL